MASIKDAIVRTLKANPLVDQWATGGIYQQRAPANSESARRTNYIVVRVDDSEGDESHTQNAAATDARDMLECRVWAGSDKLAQEGANRVRWALDSCAGEEADITITRIFWRGTVDGNTEDLSAAEQLLYGAFVRLEVNYRLPTA